MSYNEDNARGKFFFSLLHAINSKYEYLFQHTPSTHPECSERKNLSRRWGWQKVLYELADDNIINIEKIEKMNLDDVMTFLVYRKQKGIADEAQYKFDENMRKSRK